MAVLSHDYCALAQMCSSARATLEEVYPEGLPLNPGEAETLANHDLPMNWGLAPMDWPTKREVLKIWFDRGVAHLGIADEWTSDISAQLATPDSTQFDALVATVTVKIDEGGPGKFMAVAARELISLLRMENSRVAKADRLGIQAVAKVSRIVIRSAAKGTSSWYDEVVAQNSDVLAVLQRDGLPTL